MIYNRIPKKYLIDWSNAGLQQIHINKCYTCNEIFPRALLKRQKFNSSLNSDFSTENKIS
jgi:hypothetical protein